MKYSWVQRWTRNATTGLGQQLAPTWRPTWRSSVASSMKRSRRLFLRWGSGWEAKQRSWETQLMTMLASWWWTALEVASWGPMPSHSCWAFCQMLWQIFPRTLLRCLSTQIEQVNRKSGLGAKSSFFCIICWHYMVPQHDKSTVDQSN